MPPPKRQSGTSGRVADAHAEEAPARQKPKNRAAEERETVRVAQLQHVAHTHLQKCRELAVRPNATIAKQMREWTASGKNVLAAELAGVPLEARQVWALLGALRGYTPLQRIAFSACRLERGSSAAVAAFFQHHIETAAAQAASPAWVPPLQKARVFGHLPTSVTQLSLTGCGLDAADAQLLCAVIQPGSTLRELLLDYNPISSAGAAALGNAYVAAQRAATAALPCVLAIVSLRHCAIDGSLGAAALGAFLSTPAIEQVSLTPALFKKSTTNHSPRSRELYMDGNQMGNEALAVLVNALKTGLVPRLRRLSIAHNGLCAHPLALQTVQSGHADAASAYCNVAHLHPDISGLLAALAAPGASALYFLNIDGCELSPSDAAAVLSFLVAAKAGVSGGRRGPLVLQTTERISTPVFCKLLGINRFMQTRVTRLERQLVRKQKRSKA